MRRSTAICVAVSAVLLFCSTGAPGGDPRPPGTATRPAPARYPWESAADVRARQTLKARVPVLNLEHTPLSRAFDFLVDLTDLNLRVHWDAMAFSAIERDRGITLKLKNASLESVLSAILEQAGGSEVELAFEVWEGSVVISTREDLSRHTIRQIYDVDDLINVQEKHLAGYIHRVFETVAKYGGRDLANDVAAAERVVRQIVRDSREDLQNDLIDLINTCVDPESWRYAGGIVGTIGFFGDRLIVVQTITAQREIADLLAELRRPNRERPAKARWP